MMKKYFSIFALIILQCSEIISQGVATRPKQDTLKVPHTYWWPDGGPFTGMCGNSYSMVFTGTVTHLDKPLKPLGIASDTATVLHIPQNGVIKIKNLLKQGAPLQTSKNSVAYSYNNESFFISDCFSGSGLTEGDKVMVFIYSYEGGYCIPSNSILKIKNFNDPAVVSIKKYIAAKQNPLSIRQDITLWKRYNLDNALKRIIDCKLFVENQR